MEARRAFGLTAALLTSLASCETATRTSPSPAPQRPLIASLPQGGCTGLGAAAEEVTFTALGRVYAAAPDGSNLRCIAQDRPGALQWGPAADRVLLGGLQTVLSTGIGHAPTTESVRSPVMSHPTGKSIVYISSDGRLMKTSATGGAPKDISFLKRHDDVVYHHAGTHIAVAGDNGTESGVFLATNLGRNARIIAQGQGATRVHSLAYRGETLYFVGEHGDHFDVHSLRGDAIDTRYSGREPVDFVTTGPWSPGIAWRQGMCDTSMRTRVLLDGGEPVGGLGGDLDTAFTRPAGWTRDGRLLVLARRVGCGGSHDLYLWSPQKTTLLVRNVEAAAVRSVAPPAPPPPVPGSAAPA
jgi:hypothetical protein